MQISSAVSKSKKAAQRRMLGKNTNTDESSHDPEKVVEFLTREEQQKIFSDFLNIRQREQRKYSLNRLAKQKLLNNFEEKVDNEESDYEDIDDIQDNIDNEYVDDEYIDDFEDETRK